ncbi:undecaprenyl-diphosphatase UppP [Orenia metallireducens]|uniref:Undecaprenyl-diphosphatase n=1 Tax=Orenia metallireducens TaxID=1413210 RepID=A0A1C0AA55_9FIRM|nr:undecaprenyl-diphosphatase UppP [Orenia metallireducens]OCL27174.1 undecaprenyl-diphosphatase UppP [Orenia metallireducens]
MNLFKVIILGIVQGVTEFLPISSSGHLVIFQHFLDIQEGLTLDVFLHFGTLLAVAIVYWDDIVGMITLKPEYRKLTLYVILGSIPAGVIGILFEDVFEQLFATLRVVGFALLVTGTLLWLSDRVGKETRYLKDLKMSDAWVVGFAQAFAIIPGISRSGSTIVAGLFKGLDRKLAAKYSFLLSVPVIGGATLLQLKDLATVGLVNVTVIELVIGTISSVIAGYFSIKLLLKLINQEKLSIFAYYCWILGLSVILFF